MLSPIIIGKILRGSVLDKEFLKQLGKFDIVYSWGVLHHTGNMWQAIENSSQCVNEEGYLIIAIYNKQIFISSCWYYIKLFYNIAPKPIRFLLEKFLLYVFFYFRFCC